MSRGLKLLFQYKQVCLFLFFFLAGDLGWVPQTFVSSRKSKAESSKSQMPEDFMDEEVWL
jgi:hypothetical protein